MCKRLLFFVCIFLILALIVFGVYMFFFQKNNTIETFKLEDYDYYIEKFPSEEILGPTNSIKDAKSKAESVWIEKYGEGTKKKKPYSVFFDEETKVWLVQGSLPKNLVGGIPYILIRQSDGKVLAVWHTK